MISYISLTLKILEHQQELISTEHSSKNITFNSITVAGNIE